MNRLVLPLALALAACGADRFIPPDPDGGTPPADSGLPCDVAAVFATKCGACHGATPSAGAPQSLVTYDNLTAADPYDATKTNAQGSLARMKAGTMPPGGAAAADVAVVEAWVNAGAQRGTCDAAPDAGTPGDGGSTTASGLPCDVAKVLGDHCTSCHASPPRAGAPNALVTHADLVAADPYDAARTSAQGSLARMKAGTMPPGGGLTAAEIATMEAWVNAGAPTGTCDGTQPEPIPDLGNVCSSNSFYSFGENAQMRPGEACIACHTRQGEGPRGSNYYLGTVYPSLREPNDCNGKTGVTVEIIGADGTTLTGTTNSAGNFVVRGTIAMPYTAKVKANGKERVMTFKASSGDCNKCHTAAGASGAPGRIVSP